MAFDAGKVHKLQDYLESIAYDWMEDRVKDHYGVAGTDELTKEQVDEIWEYSESEDCYEPYVGMALRSICDNWQEENESEDE
jgi:hypothetical protein